MSNTVNHKYINKLTYGEFCNRMREFNRTHDWNKEKITGVIVFTPESFKKEYSLESRSYEVSSNNKAWIPGMGGYSIFASALDGSDNGVRLEAYMWAEHGGKNGWKVAYCYFLDENGEPEQKERDIQRVRVTIKEELTRTIEVEAPLDLSPEEAITYAKEHIIEKFELEFEEGMILTEDDFHCTRLLKTNHEDGIETDWENVY